MKKLTSGQYRQLLEFRTSLRGFVRWSEAQAKAAGITPAQHQLLLAIKGHPEGEPTVGDLAQYLLLRHHSAVELLDRAVRAGFAERRPDDQDGRIIRASLTAAGEAKLAELTALHLQEIERLAPMLEALSAVAGDGLPTGD